MTKSKSSVDPRSQLIISIEQCFLGHNFPNTETVNRIESLIADQVKQARREQAEYYAKTSAKTVQQARTEELKMLDNVLAQTGVTLDSYLRARIVQIGMGKVR